MSAPYDSRLILDVLPVPLAQSAFEQVRDEVEWSDMQHHGGAVPRLVCIQGDVEADGVQPIYRHPADEQPALHDWTPAVRQIRDVVSARIGQPLNHALIQMYRGGGDFISEHADKTIDVARGSAIVNVSLGAMRTMVLRPKPRDGGRKIEGARQSTRCPLPHASLFVLGWETNRRMTHEIRADKRRAEERSAEERSHGGARISITFRHVATFLTADGKVFGQGARNKRRADAAAVVCDDPAEEEALLRAFSAENKNADFEWEESLYGRGCDAVNFLALNSRHAPPGAAQTASASGGAELTTSRALAALAAQIGRRVLTCATAGSKVPGRGRRVLCACAMAVALGVIAVSYGAATRGPGTRAARAALQSEGRSSG